ncbi:MAG TPA: MFS transporter [Candidatus Binataceae bacterium]|nr:MFS transporter [Candidatus Binataceae bacterium]
MSQSSATRPPLTLGTNILYGVGSVAFGVHVAALSSLLMLFFNQVVGLPAAWVGAAMMVTLIFDAICDPLIGEWSDHTRSRWGRRHPFMYASAVPLAFAFYFLWNPPHGWSNQSLFAYLVALLVTVRLLLSLYEIPSIALAPELTLDYDQRTGLMSSRFFFGTLGGAAMGVLALQVFLRKDATHPLGLMNRAGYGQYALVGGLLMFASIMISCLGTHKFIAGLVHEPKRVHSWTERWRELSGTLTNRSFLALIASGVFGAISLGLSTTLELYVGNYYWELTPAQMSYFPMISTLSAFVGVVLAPGISRRFGKKPAMIGLFVCSTFTASGPIALRLLGMMPANHTSTLLAILLVSYFLTAALGLTGFIIISSMMADVVEDVAVVTGQRSEGLLFAANGLLNKCINGIGVFLSGLLLAAVHFPQPAVQGQVAPAILRNFALIYAPVIATCSLISIALLLFYDIDRSTHEMNVERLEEAGIEPVAKEAASAR